MALDTWRGEAGGQNKPGIGSYLEQLMAAGVISPDRIYSQQDGNTLYLGNDGNIYMPAYRQTSSGSGENMALDPVDYSNPASVWRIPLSNIDPATGKDKLNSVTDFLDPTTGQMYDQGKAGFNQMRLEEMLALGAIAAMTGGAAMHGLGLAGTGAGAAQGGGWMSGVEGAALAGPEVAATSGINTAAMGAGGAGATGFGLTPTILPEAMTLTGGQTLASTLPAVTEAGLFSNPAMWSGWGAIPEGLGYGLGATAGASFLPQALEGVPPPQLGPEGMPPPANPNLPGSNPLSNLLPEGMNKWLGPAATLLGAAAGSQGQKDTASQSQQLPSWLQGPVAQDLIPRTQGLLSAQAPAAAQAGQQMMQTGSGLLSRGVAENGFTSGAVKLDAPTSTTNPYAGSILSDMERRYKNLIAESLQGARGNAVGVGGLGGSRQGVAEGLAISRGADDFAGRGFSFMGDLYNQDQTRALQKYATDWNAYGQQRQQDLAQTSTGAGLLSAGLDTAWQPVQNAANVYGKFSPFGTQTTSRDQGGGGWTGILGGALAGASTAGKLNWW